MKSLTNQIDLLCPTCGNDQFEYSDDEEDESDDSSIIRCSDCGFECSKAELIGKALPFRQDVPREQQPMKFLLSIMA